jgi:hypothetical protein
MVNYKSNNHKTKKNKKLNHKSFNSRTIKKSHKTIETIKTKYKKNKIKIQNKKTHKNIKGGYQVVMYHIYDDDDNTINNQKGRCMCIDYKINNEGNFSTKHNEKMHRCKNHKDGNSDFCKYHKQCNSFLRNFLSGYEPEYSESELEKWKHPYIEGSHNCYSYFLNNPVEAIKDSCEGICLKKNKKGCPKKIDECRDFIPQPGDHYLLKRDGNLNNKSRVYKCDTMEQKILSDNSSVFKVPFHKKCPKNYYKGSMVVDTDHTFHFYRQNKDGTWSHKPGTLPVTNKDANGDLIHIPHFAARDYSDGDNEDEDAINYNDFCGYYCIPSTEYSNKNSV